MSVNNTLKLKTIPSHLDFPALEEQVLDYWDQIKAFERSVSERPSDKPYVFYDGPPFATGLPHYGHLLSSVMKDIFPRYFTMRGFRVERRWGWDCHGLPIENIIEKELKLEGGKKGIEAYGIANFNAACRAAILRFDSQWEKVIRRIGRWVDFTHSYKTMDKSFMESVWWAFKRLYDQGLVYQGRKVILYCPRCSTPLSNFEIAMDNSYSDITEDSTTYKFPLTGSPDTFFLAWSTTPWNKLATPALAVNPTLTYDTVQQGQEKYSLAHTRLSMLKGEYQILSSSTGKDLERLHFDLLYDFYPDRGGQKAGVIVADDYVTDQDGTGIVTLAIYGEEDYRIMVKHHIQLIEHIDEAGKFKPEVTPWAGMFILDANPLIDADLQKRGLIYDIQPLTHSVPMCYRCATRLYYAPLPAWFIDIQKLKPQLLAANEAIHWYPKHLKHGRFGKGLITAPDWNISRSRYWGTPMPIWVSSTGQIRVIGSIDELKQWAVDPEKLKHLDDLHRESVDDIEVWVDAEKIIKGQRIKEVFDCWIESGSMSFAEHHYPFENKSLFESRFPAQYISEYIAQTRAWFYTLHVVGVALFDKPAFLNALTTGTIMAEDGSKMSKSKRNFPDPMAIVDQFGVDSLRLYFATSPLMKTAQNVNFSPSAIDEIRKRQFVILWNVFAFYKLYDNGQTELDWPNEPLPPIDKWLISRIENITLQVTQAMDQYDVVTASRTLVDFVSEFSQFWLRLSRDRLRQKETNRPALQVFRTALFRYQLLLAPIAPFFTELIYQNICSMSDSIHLEPWILADQSRLDLNLEDQVKELRLIIEKAHSLRKEKGVKARQPLSVLTVHSPLAKPDSQLCLLLTQELNVKTIAWQAASDLTVELDFNLTPDLKAEGQARELIRAIQNERRKLGTSHDELVIVELPDWPEAYTGYIRERVLASDLRHADQLRVFRV